MHDPNQMINALVIKNSNGEVIQESGLPVLIDHWSASGRGSVTFIDDIILDPEVCDTLLESYFNTIIET